MSITQSTTQRATPSAGYDPAFVPILIRVPRMTPHPATRAALNRGPRSRSGAPAKRRRLRREVRLVALALGLGLPLAWGVLTLAGPASSLLSRPVPTAGNSEAAAASAPDPSPAWATLSIAPVDEPNGALAADQQTATRESVAPGEFRLPTLGFEGSLDAGH